MKKSYIYLGLIALLGFGGQSMAQTDPGTTNLKHQWTFDEGVIDHVGNLEGTLVGAAKVASKALNTTSGGHFSMPAEQIGINAYPELTLELWYTSASGVNTGNTMHAYFGNTRAAGDYGVNYLYMAGANGSRSRGAISCLNESEPWSAENGVNGTKYDDGLLHHLVTVVDAEEIIFYIDGVRVGADSLSTDNSIANIASAKALLAASGYTNDPTWKGLIHKFSIYNKALSDANVLYMFQDGAEDQEVMTTTMSAIGLDTNYPAEMFNFSSANLGNDIEITAPAGIMVEPSTITKNQNDVPVAVIWDMVTPVDGDVLFKSGSTEVAVRIKTVDDSQCFTRLYDNVENIVVDMGCNNLSNFGGWGAKSMVTVIDDPTNVYCGANAISVGNGVGTGTGSLDVVLTGLILPSTTYRVKAMVKTIGGTYQIGVWGWQDGQGDLNNPIDTQGEWMPLEFTFTTGETLKPSDQGMFFNNYNLTGTMGYIDNWEMYEVLDPVLSVNYKELAFDPEYKSADVIVTGSNLFENVTVTAPAGFTLSTASFTPNEEGRVIADTVTVTWDGTTAVAGDLVIAGGSASVVIPAKTTAVSNLDCYVPLYTDKTNIVPDPYLNDPTKFGGWGEKKFVSIVSKPDSVLCGSHSGLIDGGGSMDVILTGLMKTNTQYIARLQIRTFGGNFQLGVWGMDAFNTADVSDSLDTQEAWAPITLTFATGDSLPDVQGMFLNNYQRTGKRAFLDNWELYDLGPLNVINPEVGENKIYMAGGRIVADFHLATAAPVDLTVYNLQGAQILAETMSGNAGKNVRMLNSDLAPGVYIVKVHSQGKQFVGKVIK